MILIFWVWSVSGRINGMEARLLGGLCGRLMQGRGSLHLVFLHDTFPAPFQPAISVLQIKSTRAAKIPAIFCLVTNVKGSKHKAEAKWYTWCTADVWTVPHNSWAKKNNIKVNWRGAPTSAVPLTYRPLNGLGWNNDIKKELEMGEPAHSAGCMKNTFSHCITKLHLGLKDTRLRSAFLLLPLQKCQSAARLSDW